MPPAKQNLQDKSLGPKRIRILREATLHLQNRDADILQTSSRAANIISPFKQVQNRRYNYPLDQEAWKISFELEINLSHARMFRDAKCMSQSLQSH